MAPGYIGEGAPQSRKEHLIVEILGPAGVIGRKFVAELDDEVVESSVCALRVRNSAASGHVAIMPVGHNGG